MANYMTGAHFNKRMYDIMANKIAALTALNKELSEENSSLKNKIAEYERYNDKLRKLEDKFNTNIAAAMETKEKMQSVIAQTMNEKLKYTKLMKHLLSLMRDSVDDDEQPVED